MKLDKATQILKFGVNSAKILRKSDLGDAMKLGIEALKRIEAYRLGFTLPYNTPLPGETED